MELSPDDLAAPGLRRALTAERGKREALEQERARLLGVVARQNERLAEWAAQQQALQRRMHDLLGRVEALTAQNAALAGERPGGTRALREENARLRAAGGGGEQQGAAARRPPSFVKAKATPRGKRKRRKRSGEPNRGRGRLGSERMTREVVHAAAACPRCEAALAGGWAQRRVQHLPRWVPATCRRRRPRR